MSRALLSEFGWGGLSTKATTTGLPVMDSVVLQDLRVVGKDLVQRLGMVRVARLSHTFLAMDFDAASSEHCLAAVDARVWTLGTKFTIEVTVSPDIVTGTRPVFCAGSTTSSVILDTNTSSWRWRIWDSAATLTTVTVGTATASTTQTIQLIRDGASLTSRLDNVAGGTGTMSATLATRAPVGNFIIAGDGTNFYDGKIDKLDLLSVVKSDHNDRLLRLPNPRSPHVLCSMDFNESAAALVYDRSRYENHLVSTNTPTETTSLSHNPAFVRGLSMMSDENQRKQLLMIHGGNYSLAAVD